jgi:hypothetical protein
MWEIVSAISDLVEWNEAVAFESGKAGRLTRTRIRVIKKRCGFNAGYIRSARSRPRRDRDRQP